MQYKIANTGNSEQPDGFTNYLPDIPTVTISSRSGMITNLTLEWTPKSRSLSQFSLVASDSKMSSAVWTPDIFLCDCFHSSATCMFTSDPNFADIINQLSDNKGTTINYHKLIRRVFLNYVVQPNYCSNLG